jgi:hypothetical protein
MLSRSLREKPEFGWISEGDGSVVSVMSGSTFVINSQIQQITPVMKSISDQTMFLDRDRLRNVCIYKAKIIGR